MKFYNIFDLLRYTAHQKNLQINEMMIYFKERGISKAELLKTKHPAYYPSDKTVAQTFLTFLGISELELNLILGKLPKEYEETYFDNITQIAALLKDGKKLDEKPTLKLPIFNSKRGTLYNNDCIDVMKNFEDSTFDLIFADPPFNLNKDYDDGVCDDLSVSDYLNWTMRWVGECVRLLKPGGYLFIYNIPKWCTYIAGYLNQHLTFWDWIAIDMKCRLPIHGRLYPAHYGLIAYIKGTKPSTYNNLRIPLQTCRHCGGDVKDYGGYKSKMNPLGVNLSDIWSDIYPVRHKSTKKRKFNELPVKLLDRIISLATNEGDTVFDPFGGSGTTYAVAELLGRRWVGCEIGNCDVIIERLQNLSNDKGQLEKINTDKGLLFTEYAQKLRKQNDFWLVD